MNNENELKSKTPLTKRQRRDAILKAMGQRTPNEQALDFQRQYLANWMSKRAGGDSSGSE